MGITIVGHQTIIVDHIHDGVQIRQYNDDPDREEEVVFVPYCRLDELISALRAASQST